MSQGANPEAEELVADLRRTVHARAPQVLPFIKQMYVEGLIRGWRDITAINAPEPKQKER